MEQLRAIAGVGNPRDLAAALQLEAEALTPDLLRGLQWRLAARMVEQINQLPLDNPEDYGRMVDVIDKLDAIIHRHRGEEITSKGDRAKIPITLEEFKAYRRATSPRTASTTPDGLARLAAVASTECLLSSDNSRSRKLSGSARALQVAIRDWFAARKRSARRETGVGLLVSGAAMKSPGPLARIAPLPSPTPSF